MIIKFKLVPLAGVIVSLALFTISASLYPGGYDWTREFVCSLFAPSTPTGVANKSRFVAILAMFVLCLSLAIMFWMMSRNATRRIHAKTLEIGGIGSAVYGFLVVTPMHDLLVGIALLFFLSAMLATLHWMRVEGRPVLFRVGLLSLGLLAACSTIYYGHLFWNLLPIAQKLSLAACVGWLLTIQIVTVRTIMA